MSFEKVAAECSPDAPDDVEAIVGVTIIEGKPVPVVQLIFAADLPLLLPLHLTAAGATGKTKKGEESRVFLLGEPDKIFKGKDLLLLLEWDDSFNKFFDAIRVVGFFLVEMYTPKKMLRATAGGPVYPVEVLLRADITPEEYQRVSAGGYVRPMEDYPTA